MGESLKLARNWQVRTNSKGRKWKVWWSSFCIPNLKKLLQVLNFTWMCKKKVAPMIEFWEMDCKNLNSKCCTWVSSWSTFKFITITSYLSEDQISIFLCKIDTTVKSYLYLYLFQARINTGQQSKAWLNLVLGAYIRSAGRNFGKKRQFYQSYVYSRYFLNVWYFWSLRTSERIGANLMRTYVICRVG